MTVLLRNWNAIIFSMLFPLAMFAADTTRYTVQHYTDDNGLPQNSVKSIAKDPDGFIWLATEGGLVRYSGREFTVFDRKKTGAHSSRMHYVIPDADKKTLYALADTLTILQIKNSIVERIHLHDFPELRTLDFSEVVKRLPATGLPDPFWADHKEWNFLRVNSSAYYFTTRDSVFYHDASGGSYRIRQENSHPYTYFLQGDDLFFYDEKKNFFKVEKDSTKRVSFTGDILGDPYFKEGRVFSQIYWNISTGDAFLNLQDRLYLLRWSNDGSFFTRLLLKGFDFDRNDIVSVLWDEPSGKLFFGSLNAGLFILRPSGFHTYQSQNEEASNVYYSQTSIGTNSILTHSGELFTPEKPVTYWPAIKKYSDLHSLAKDQYGNIWSKKSDVIWRFDTTGNARASYRLPCPASQLYAGAHGKLWIGTMNCGVFVMEPPFLNYRPVISDVKEVSYLLEESGKLWIGTNTGLFQLDSATRRLDTIAGLKGIQIRSLYVSGPGQLWITTYDEGFFLYRNRTLHRFPLDKQGYLSRSHCMLEDEGGYFWITTNKGLFKASKIDLLAYADGTNKNLFYQYYSKSDGLPTNEFNGSCQPCGLRLPDGNFSFPSINGIVLFDPLLIKENVPRGEIFIDGVGLDSSVLKPSDTLHLPRRFTRLQFYISTPFLGDPSMIQWSYALVRDRDDTIWYDVPEPHIITLSSVQPGTSKLVIRKSNGFGNNNFTYKTIILEKQRAFQETPWFVVLLISLIILCMILYTRLRMRYIKARNRELEAAVSAQTADLKRSFRSLQASEKELKRQALVQKHLISAIAHDIKSPLKYVVMTARYAYQHMINGDYRTMEKTAKMLYDSSSRVYHLTDNLLEYIQVQSAQGNVVFESVDIKKLVDEKIKIFEPVAANQNTLISNQIPSRMIVESNAKLLAVVVNNLLDNAIKATPNGIVKISAVVNESDLELIVDDNGVGMSRELIRWCNEEAGAIPEGQEPLTPGLGLVMVKDLLSFIKGSLHVEAKPDRGTIVKVVLKTAANQ